MQFFEWPSSNTEFWRKAIGNRERDLKNYNKLREMGWNVLIVWECELKKDKEKCLERIIKELESIGN